MLLKTSNMILHLWGHTALKASEVEACLSSLEHIRHLYREGRVWLLVCRGKEAGATSVGPPKSSWLFSLSCSQLWVCSMWVDKKQMNDIAVVITYRFPDDEEGGLKGPESFANNSGHSRPYLAASLHPQIGDHLVGEHTGPVPSPPAHSDY